MLRSTVIVFLSLVFCLGCNKGAAPNETSFPPLETTNEEITEQTSPAQRYGLSNESPNLTSLEEEIWRKLLQNNGPLSCELDSQLVQAARVHARDLSGPTPIDSAEGIDYLRHALRMFGSMDYQITPMIFPVSQAGMAALAKLIDTRKDDWTHCGLGVHESSDNTLGVWIGTGRTIQTNSIPVSPRTNTTIPLKGRLLNKGIKNIEAYLEHPSGQITRPKSYIVGREYFTILLPVTLPGRYSLELQVERENGPETVVLVPLYSEIPVDTRPIVVPSYDPPEQDPKQTLTNLINSVRKKHGQSPLTRDSRLDKVAQSHCMDMKHLGFFGHYSPRSGTLAHRLEKQALYPTSVGENVARSSSIFRIHANLMRSPSHKMKILSPQYTHLGLGIIETNGIQVVTEIFAKW